MSAEGIQEFIVFVHISTQGVESLLEIIRDLRELKGLERCPIDNTLGIAIDVDFVLGGDALWHLGVCSGSFERCSEASKFSLSLKANIQFEIICERLLSSDSCGCVGEAASIFTFYINIVWNKVSPIASFSISIIRYGENLSAWESWVQRSSESRAAKEDIVPSPDVINVIHTGGISRQTNQVIIKVNENRFLINWDFFHKRQRIVRFWSLEEIESNSGKCSENKQIA